MGMKCYNYEGMARTCSTKSPSRQPESNLALFSFFHFIRRFWNQILICLSVRQRAWAISILLRRVRYRLKWNSFSSSSVWKRVYVCLPRFRSAFNIKGQKNSKVPLNCLRASLIIQRASKQPLSLRFSSFS